MKNHLSPFRYPGGKSWLIGHVRRWLNAQANKPKLLIEPFSGGAGISLTAVHERLVEKAVFAEIDQDVAATWETVLNGHATWLTKEILSFKVTREGVQARLKEQPKTKHERAFQCLLRNRTARGGVLLKSAGLIRYGEDGKGLKSRWYPKTLTRRIETIANLKPKLNFRKQDAFEVIANYLNRAGTVFFIDPPYTQAARRLYKHWDIEHEKLFAIISKAKGDVLMTYDDTKEVRELASRYSFQVKTIPMRTTHHQMKKELMICRDFGWMSALEHNRVRTIRVQKHGVNS